MTGESSVSSRNAATLIDECIAEAESHMAEHQLPRAWCHRLKGPCAARCFGGECRMIDFPDTEPAPELEQRMPPGTQIVIALLSGMILGLVFGLLWTWWQT